MGWSVLAAVAGDAFQRPKAMLDAKLETVGICPIIKVPLAKDLPMG